MGDCGGKRQRPGIRGQRSAFSLYYERLRGGFLSPPGNDDRYFVHFYTVLPETASSKYRLRA